MNRAEFLGNNLRGQLSMSSYTQGELAEKLGVSRMTINNYLNGKSEIPHDKIYKIAEVLNTSPEQIDMSLENEERTRRVFTMMKEFTENYKEKIIEYVRKKGFDVNVEVERHNLDDDNKHISENLKYYMKIYGYNQMKLAKLLNISPNKAGMILRGETPLSLKEVKIASKEFGVPPSEIDMNLYDDPRLMQIYLYSMTLGDDDLIDLEGKVSNIYHSYILREGWDRYE